MDNYEKLTIQKFFISLPLGTRIELANKRIDSHESTMSFWYDIKNFINNLSELEKEVYNLSIDTNKHINKG